MSDVDFLIGRKVVEVRPNPDGSGRVIFELGDRPEPTLYADVGRAIYEDRNLRLRPLADVINSVVSAVSTEAGTLVLSFGDGGRLRCDPDPKYEAWQVVGGTPQHLVVCTPGGELAIWDSSHIPTDDEAHAIVEELNELTGWDARFREVTETGGILIDPRPNDDDSESDARDG